MLIVLTVVEVAEWLKLSTVTVQRMVKANKIPHKRVGPKVTRFTPKALNEWIGTTNESGQEKSLPKLLTIKEIAEELDVSVQFVLDRVLSKEIKAVRVGGSWRITEKQYKLWLDSLSA